MPRLRIIGRVQEHSSEGAYSFHVHRDLATEPFVVMHATFENQKASGPIGLGVRRVEDIAHTEHERPSEHGDMDRRRMPMRREASTVWVSKACGEQPVRRRVADKQHPRGTGYATRDPVREAKRLSRGARRILSTHYGGGNEDGDDAKGQAACVLCAHRCLEEVTEWA